MAGKEDEIREHIELVMVAASKRDIIGAEKLRVKHQLDVNIIAGRAAHNGHRDYAEYLRTKHGADVKVILEGSKQGG